MIVAGLEFTVKQDAAPCEYAINPVRAFFPAAGGEGTVHVTAPKGCAWTAMSKVSWVAIKSGEEGVGSGAVFYSVAANSSSRHRRGFLDIAGNRFIVWQQRGAR